MMELGVIFGSRASEHDVSIISGLQILENADKSKYHAFPIYIARSGAWYVGEPLRDVKTYRDFDPQQKGLTRVFCPRSPAITPCIALAAAFLARPSGSAGWIAPSWPSTGCMGRTARCRG